MWYQHAATRRKQVECLIKIALRWTSRLASLAFSTWVSRARKEGQKRGFEQKVIDRWVTMPLNSAFDSWLLYTCREQRQREIAANNLVSTYMSEKEAEWESESSLLRSAVDELHDEVYTLQDDFAAAHMTTMRRAQDLIVREQTKAQERLEEAALELERVRTELLSSTSKPATPSESGAKSRKHMAFF